MKTMYKMIVKTYVTEPNIYKEHNFSNEVDGGYIFNKEEIDSVMEIAKNQIQDVINRNNVYGGINNSVPATIEISADSCENHMRGYINFSCEKANVMVVVDFIHI